MSKNKPSYYAILPSNVRYDNRLNANEKIMYSEITALTQSTGQCWASNRYFADLYKVTPQAISKWIKKIEKLGYIKITYVYREGTKMIEKRFISLVSIDVSTVSTEIEGGINSGLGGYQQPIKDNITSFNNTSINNNPIIPLEEVTEKIPYKEIIDYLNEKTGKGFKTAEGNKKYIRYRWNEGYRVEDFKKVIDNKVATWKGKEWRDTKNRLVKGDTFLRPSTLFANKFDEYLNEEGSNNEENTFRRNPIL